jgi:predicted nuclease of predicted toxin-antitoxin system
LRLLIDENVSPKITARLREEGYDVKSVSECCTGLHDDKIAEVAVKEERTIITFDLDFGELYQHLGVSSIVLRVRTKDPSIIIKRLIDFLQKMEKQKISIKNRLAILTEGKIRLIG